MAPFNANFVSGEDDNIYDAVLQDIEQFLTEEDREDVLSNTLAHHGPLALQAIEKSLYDAIEPSRRDPSLSSIDSDCMFQQFNRGVEEARRFLPRLSTVCEFEKSGMWQHAVVGGTYKGGRKSRDVDYDDEGEAREGRVFKKLLTICDEKEGELLRLFEALFLDRDHHWHAKNFVGGKMDEVEDGIVSCGKKKRGKKKKEVIDLGNLLAECARAVAGDDRKAAEELLQQIRKHSSATGDGSQRQAHYFADALEVRMAGTRFRALPRLNSPLETLQAHVPLAAVCPFRLITYVFMEYFILKLAQTATTLHIIDFGIGTGLQWVTFIKKLSARPGGPPKLRITGIELPQQGICPGDAVDRAGRLLVNYSHRFNMPFQYNGIAQKWETIDIKDLMIGQGEAIAVTCMLRSEKTMDEGYEGDSPRNAVLKFIRSVNPDIFVHSVVHASLGANIFPTRFQEAQFHYRTLFDMLDTVMRRDSWERMFIEKQLCGDGIMNVIACEGSERVERAEKYKRWQARSLRAGFRRMPLDTQLVEALRAEVQASFHKDFIMDADGHWLLQGWKGRTVCAICCWVPSRPSQS